MNKNFIGITTVVGVLIGGSFIAPSITNNPELDYYNDSYGKSKISNSKQYKIIEPTILDSKMNAITPLSVLSSIGNEDELILREFVGSIVKNSKPLDSDFSALIDENFWDLV